MFYITCLIFKTQINHIRFLEEFKMNEILCVTTFNIICIPNFDTKCVHYTMETQNMYVEVLNFHKPNLTFHKTFML
jgi:hypothetical protein